MLEIAGIILRNWRIVLVLPLLLGLAAALWSLSQDRTYAASASFMQQTSENRQPAGAAALAQQFGLNLDAEGPGQSPEFYADLLRSRRLLRQAVETEYQLTREGQPWAGTLIDFWKEDLEPGALPGWQRATEMLSDALSTSVNRETGVVALTVSSEHPALSEQVAQRLLELLNEFNLEVRQSRAEEEREFIGGWMSEANAELLAAERALQDFVRQNRGFRNSPELMFEYERLQRQIMMQQEVFASLLRSHEQARIDAVRDIPLFTVIDRAEGTAKPEGRRTVIRTALALVFGMVLAMMLAYFREFSRRSRAVGDPTYRDFQRSVREAWADFRHPGRWFRRRSEETVVSDA